jgi:hypothetical protein
MQSVLQKFGVILAETRRIVHHVSNRPADGLAFERNCATPNTQAMQLSMLRAVEADASRR